MPCSSASTTSGASATSRGAPRALWGLAWVEFWAGRWALAAAHAAHAHDISIQYGLEVPQDHLPIAVIAVHRGQLELAREHSERALELAEEQFALHPPQHLAVLGLAALWSGDSSAAAEWLGEADQQAATLGWGEPSVRWWTLRLRRASPRARPDRRRGARPRRLGGGRGAVGREWVLAHVDALPRSRRRRPGRGRQAAGPARAGGCAARGRGRPFRPGPGTARARRRQPARTAEAPGPRRDRGGARRLRAARRRRLGRRRRAPSSDSIGGRTREEGLTAAERRVAALVAEGRTNREVAAALFLGERTVAEPPDAHLRQARRTLAHRTRAPAALTNAALPGKVQTF